MSCCDGSGTVPRWSVDSLGRARLVRLGVYGVSLCPTTRYQSTRPTELVPPRVELGLEVAPRIRPAAFLD